MSFPLLSIPHTNLVHVLKKLNDGSFVTSLRTCRHVLQVAECMDRKTRILCYSLLPIFAYFDEEDDKIMFDVYSKKKKEEANDSGPIEYVPYQSSREIMRDPANFEEDDSSSDFEDEEMNEDEEDYEECQEHEGECDCKMIRNELEEALDCDCPISHLKFIRSSRKRSVHWKLSIDELVDLLSHFRFEIATIDKPLDPLERQPVTDKESLAFRGIVDFLQYIIVADLRIDATDNEEIFHEIVNSTKNMRVTYLRIHNNTACNMINKLQIDYHTLKGLEAQADTKFDNLLMDLVFKWRAGKTSLVHLQLNIQDEHELEFRHERYGAFPLMTVKPEHHIGEANLYFLQEGDRLALLITFYGIIRFKDVSQCEGCYCQKSFCFTKLVETVTEYYDAEQRPTDFGSLFDEWDGFNVNDLRDMLEHLYN